MAEEYMIDEKDFTEEDTKYYFITPVLDNKGWYHKIHFERDVEFTDGRIINIGNSPTRSKPEKADYLLYAKKNYPIAVLEAKSGKYTVDEGLSQAIDYAQKLDLMFAFSSNGKGFCEHDLFTGIERYFYSMDEFPTYDDLVDRYKGHMNGGHGMTEAQSKIMEQPYYTSVSVPEPRYYQRIAINRIVDATVSGQNRILLLMATGTGKTYTAFQVVYRLLKSGIKKKILYLADRNILVDQTIQKDFSPLNKSIHKINFAKDKPDTITSHEVYFSLYHQLSGNDENDDVEEEHDENMVSKLKELFKPDFFDLVIVDECHRGSARANSRWRLILDYFNKATQIGMTATPKESVDASNISYFGEPIYTYTLKQGIEDGFLAPFRVINIKTNIGDGWRPTAGQLDAYGEVIPDREYNNRDYDYNIVIEDRIRQVAEEITNYLKNTDRMQKTIVFCANEEHANRMRSELNNLNNDITREHPDYVVRITSSDKVGKSKMKYFLSTTEKYPVIATTSKLLSTGVDCRTLKLIVIDQNINSVGEFKQIVGRGTRISEKEGKTDFTIMDFRGVSRLFADPDWDGEPEVIYDPNDIVIRPSNTATAAEKRKKPIINADGCRVEIINKIVSIYDVDGKLLATEDIIDYTKTNILGVYASLSYFIDAWSKADKKEEISRLFKDEYGIDIEMLKRDQNMSDVDDFDFICHIAYNQKPLTRKERADGVKKRDFFAQYSGIAREVLEILLDKYMNAGIYQIENNEVLKLDPIKKYGSPAKIVESFGGKEMYIGAIQSLEEAIYAVE